MKNIKEILSTICAVVIAICGVMAGLNATVLGLPTWVTTVGIIGVAIGTAIIGVLTGRNPNGTTKTPIQVEKLNSEAASTKDIK